MKYLSILIVFLLVIISSCDTDDDDYNAGNPDTGGGTDGGTDPYEETDLITCENCIWLQDNCEGKWNVGYNSNTDIGGFQFNVEGAIINNASGGDAEIAGFNPEVGTNIILAFSFGGAVIPAGIGILTILELEGTPTSLSGIVISDSEANSIDFTYDMLYDCEYEVSLEDTGESQLTIFLETITSLTPGDKIGIFDLQAITNYNDCSNQIGELLVGSGTWNGSQLNIVSIGSVDLCSFEGPQLAGFVVGNEVVVRVRKLNQNMEGEVLRVDTYDTELTWEESEGKFGNIIQTISNITLTNLSLSKESF